MIIDLGLVASQTAYGLNRLSQVNSSGRFALEQSFGSDRQKMDNGFRDGFGWHCD
jgi:hypothetical protein